MLLPGREYLRICKSHSDSTTLHHDNQGVLKLAKNATLHYNARHLEVQCHFRKELVENKQHALQYCAFWEQTIDTLSMLLGPDKFEYLSENLSLISSMTIK